MSITVFAGSAQFAALAVLSAGGGALPAIVAGILLNLRFVPMGIAIAPWLRHRAWLRALRGQALVDASWAMASRGDGHFDVDFLLGATAVQYPAWVLGTVAGVLAGGVITNPDALGFDAIFPAFFLGLLVVELRRSNAAGVALLGAAIALSLTPLAPPGVPIIAAAAAALLGLRRAASGVIAARGPRRVSAAVWITVGGLTVATAAIKAFGPLVFGGRRLPPLVARVIPLLAPALLAALVVTETTGGHGRTITIDARLAGLAAAGVALWRGAPLIVVVIVAAAVTALLRAVT